MNDLEMLKVAKYGFVVENGEDRVKEEVDLIAASCDESAIKFVINYIKNKI